MGGETLPMTVAVCCAASLSLASCVVVTLARDQHAAARRLRRAVGVCACACALSAGGLIARPIRASGAPAAMDDSHSVTLAIFLLAGWAVAALTLVELARCASLVVGGGHPLRLRLAGPSSPSFTSRATLAPRLARLREPAARRFAALAVVAGALAVTCRSAPSGTHVAWGGVAAPGLAGRMALVLDAVLAALALALVRVSPRRAAGVVAFATLLTGFHLAYLLFGARH